MVRLLIVDDSSVKRRLLRYLCEASGRITIVGEARNGEEAVAKVAELAPDVVTMDLHMPVMEGFEATRLIMQSTPVPIIIVSSSWDPKDLAKTFAAIECGAVTVTSAPTGQALAIGEPQAPDLAELICAMAEVKVVRRWPSTKPQQTPGQGPSAATNRAPHAVRQHQRVVAIGASTGGPPALRELLVEIDRTFPYPLLIVQHISPGFVLGLAEWLNQESPLPVSLAVDGQAMRPGHVYLAPDKTHLTVTPDERIALVASPPVENLRPAATCLFESVLRAYGSDAVGVLLTGMGRDGADALAAMHQHGCLTFAQDAATCVVNGMPGAAVALGAASHVLAPDAIGRHLGSLAAP